MPFESITDTCQTQLRHRLRPGDWALDATAGNGNDTLCLAQAVGPGGRVWAIDVQAAALEATQHRLRAAACANRVTLLRGDHAQLATLLPPEANGRLRAIVFNLGYLPGGDKAVTTQTTSTLIALDAARAHIAPGGLLAIVCYPGHPAGATEAQAVEAWARAAAEDADFQLEEIRVGPKRRPPPYLLCLNAQE